MGNYKLAFYSIFFWTFLSALSPSLESATIAIAAIAGVRFALGCYWSRQEETIDA